MKKIWSYKLFIESLEDDFKNTINDYDSNDELNIGREAERFLAVLPEKSKSEFMYRVSDDEDIFELIEEFLERGNIDSNSANNFWNLIKFHKTKQLNMNTKTDAIQSGNSLINLSIEHGVDTTIDQIIKNLSEDITVDVIIDILEESIKWLESELEIEEWYNKKTNFKDGFEEIIRERIESGKNLVKILREQSGHELY